MPVIKADDTGNGDGNAGMNQTHGCQRSPSFRSQKSDSTSSGIRPSSVYLAGSPLVRVESDLSGSYLGGNSIGSGKGGVPNSIYEPSHLKGPWRQAYVLSKDPSAVSSHLGGNDDLEELFLSEHSVVEVIQRQGGNAGLLAQASKHKRIPIIVLLMDPNAKSFELMQLWIDCNLDTVRDCLHAIQHAIPETWKQAYDGLFQMRGDKFSQLINILTVSKYEVLPYEVWIARPWAMSAKVTTGFAEAAVRYLTDIGVLVRTLDEKKKDDERLPPSRAAESILQLSKIAQKRIFAPEGIMDHHHAYQFFSISPPLDTTVPPSSLLINRRDEASIASNEYDLGQNTSAYQFTPTRDSSHNMSSLTIHSTSMLTPQHGLHNPPASNDRNEMTVASSSSTIQDCDAPRSIKERKSRSLSRIFLKLLWKMRCDKKPHEHRQPKLGDFSAAAPAVQERKWSTFDITSPITEDQSSVAYSEASMSAPLLLRRSATGGPNRYRPG